MTSFDKKDSLFKKRKIELKKNLNKRKKDIRKFVNYIENSIIEFLRLFNIESKSDRKNIGIWVKDKKIAAIVPPAKEL